MTAVFSQRRLALGLWSTVVAAAVALTVLAAREPTLPGDVRLAREAQDLPIPDRLADVVRAMTTTELVVGTGAVFAAALWLAGFRKEGVALLAAVTVLPLLQSGVKELVDRPRPSPDLVELRAGFSSPSFPAGHVMSPTVLYGYAGWLARRATRAWLRAGVIVPCAAVLVLTGVVNVYLGVHWPSDVVGGYLWGFALLGPAVDLGASGGSAGTTARAASRAKV
ncbi:MAG TPA: phosphatase PAP2 family protein [Dehalococcoidia bacterium]|nr:phosphatase PAP2 family protein [Dehalococcoidia bacterium]